MMHWLLSFFQNRNFGAVRSSEWGRVRKEHIRQFPKCAICGKTGLLIANHVHHITPVWLTPSRELDPLNLITLCPAHHFELGHFFSWHSYNEKIEQLAEDIKNRP